MIFFCIYFYSTLKTSYYPLSYFLSLKVFMGINKHFETHKLDRE